jgi:hypothetical protein
MKPLQKLKSAEHSINIVAESEKKPSRSMVNFLLNTYANHLERIGHGS